jgi:hypothetical protein
VIRFILGVHDLVFNPGRLWHFGFRRVFLLEFLLLWLVIGVFFLDEIAVDCVEVIIIFGKAENLVLG